MLIIFTTLCALYFHILSENVKIKYFSASSVSYPWILVIPLMRFIVCEDRIHLFHFCVTKTAHVRNMLHNTIFGVKLESMFTVVVSLSFSGTTKECIWSHGWEEQGKDNSNSWEAWRKIKHMMRQKYREEWRGLNIPSRTCLFQQNTDKDE